MNTTFSFKILYNLLSCYTSGPGPSGIAWQHLLEFSRPILRHTPRCSKNKLLILETSKKLKNEMLWGKQNYNQTTETQTSRIKIVDLIGANVDTESEKLLYLKLQVFLWSLFSSIPSPVYLQSWELYCWQCASINTERKETKPLRGV